ncbi:MAG: low molecular weight protein-tyrosine-phosphatase [Dokdonella sp.]|uniref:low molecular weight protein-tyrosine-phosphatase n=1 Tax=Dokdonella sp. TaxID=2291710 RepID=UPI003262E590
MRRVLFVCMGNICRSPIVESVARVEFARAGVDVHVASAGTESYHVGNQADPRAIRVAELRGYPLSEHRARQVQVLDFATFDHLLAMDRVNLEALQRISPASARSNHSLFLVSAGLGNTEVPDPYYGVQADFERVVDLARAGVAGLIGQARMMGEP